MVVVSYSYTHNITPKNLLLAFSTHPYDLDKIIKKIVEILFILPEQKFMWLISSAYSNQIFY